LFRSVGDDCDNHQQDEQDNDDRVV